MSTHIPDALLELYKDLRNAYWYASTIKEKDRLAALADAVSDLNMAILGGAIVKNDKVYEQSSEQLTSTVAALEKARKDIGKLVKHVETAAKLAGGLAKVLKLLV